MRLTTFSDYAFRVLIYVGSRPGGRATIAGIAGAYRISPDHLRKVVHFLAQEGYLETVRGKGGGMRLAKPPREIGVGALLRAAEEDFDLVECFAPAGDCRIAPACSLPSVLSEATAAFAAVFDKYTLADLVEKRSTLGVLLGFRAALPGEDCTL